jgi:hypothetical protein
MPRFVLKAIPSEECPEYLRPEDIENGTTVVELGEDEKRFVLATVPGNASDEAVAQPLDVLQGAAPTLPVVVITEGMVVEIMEIKQVESAWERL